MPRFQGRKPLCVPCCSPQPLLDCLYGMAQTARPDPGPLTIARQGSFFIGGRDVKSDTLSTLPAYASSGTITVDQMYVRYQVPVGRHGVPITLIHGCCLTGKTWETTPGRPHGLGRIFCPPQPSDLCHRPGLARPLRGRPLGDQRRRSGKAAGRPTADGVFRRPRGRLGDLPLRQGISADHARHALSARGPGRVLEADGAGQPQQPARRPTRPCRRCRNWRRKSAAPC